MGMNRTAELVNGPFDGKMLSIPEGAEELYFPAIEDLSPPPKPSEAASRTPVGTLRKVVYRRNHQLHCHEFQCIAMNHHRYVYAGTR